MKVQEVMRERAVFCGLDTTLAAAVDLMCKNGCGFLPVVGEGGNVIGRDHRSRYLHRARHSEPKAHRRTRQGCDASQAVHLPKLFTCTPDDDIHCVLKTMRIEKIRRVPVINREGTLLGILSLDDIVLMACECAGKHGISCQDVVDAYKAICPRRKLPIRRRPAAA